MSSKDLTKQSSMENMRSSGSLKVKRLFNGRIFMFTDKNSKDDSTKIKDILTELGLDSTLSEIRIDGKVSSFSFEN